MPIQSRKNQYLGINAHLHSHWQTQGGWNNFHNRHIGDMAGMLRQQLVPIGYTAYIEESLQIRRKGDSVREPKADILISDRQPDRIVRETSHQTAILTVAEMVEEDEETEKPYRAIVIYELEKKEYGEPIAWIELLSPTNKGNDQDARIYRAKRRVLLDNGFTFVEIDYLHESPSTFMHWPDYSKRQGRSSEAHPYRIVVLNPRPDITFGPAEPYEFDVDERIPAVPIPLLGDERIMFDFDACYQKTFEEMVYGLEFVNYEELPLHFQRYSPADQTRIARRMLVVLEAKAQGIDLETGPFEVKMLDLDETLAQIEALKLR